MTESVKDAMNVIQVVPDELPDAWIVRYGFVSPIWGLVAGCRSLDYYVINKWLSNVRDFGLKDK